MLMQCLIVSSSQKDGALAATLKSTIFARCAGKCFQKQSINIDNGVLVLKESLAASIVQTLYQNFRVRYAGKYFLIRNMTRNNGAIVYSDTLPAMAVFTRNAPRPNAKLVKRVTTQNAKLKVAPSNTTTIYSSRRIRRSCKNGCVQHACTLAVKGVAKSRPMQTGDPKDWHRGCGGPVQSANKNICNSTTRSTNECGRSSMTPTDESHLPVGQVSCCWYSLPDLAAQPPEFSSSA